ncbi:MAG: PF20097 family protein [Planctomycetota bacterium]|nr:PF20097 family protein [Planctomycetota bacterium]
MRDPSCPECRERMEEGFVPDATYGQTLQAHWMPGSPEKATFFGVKLGSTKIDRKQMLPIRAYRCKRCGLVRHYA